jgi:hypothetical protein
MPRTLQQAAGATGRANVVHVGTSDEFQEAVRAGARHIEITQQLDLTYQEAASYNTFVFFKLQVLPSTWSIRVRPPCASLSITVDEHTGNSRVPSRKGTVSTPQGGPSPPMLAAQRYTLISSLDPSSR